MASGRTPGAAAVHFLGSFNNLASLLAVPVFLAGLFARPGWLAAFRRPWVLAAMAGAATLTIALYALVLHQLWQAQGLALLADILLHLVLPILLIVWFVGFNRSGTLTYADLPLMLLPSVLYIFYVLARAQQTGDYPYPFANVAAMGPAQVVINMTALLVVQTVLNAIAVAIDKSTLASKI